MGAHHFKLHMVPPSSRPIRDADGDYTGDFLLAFDLSDDVVTRLRTLLPKPNHWGEVEEFNSVSDWGSDLRISHAQGGRISDITMRYAPAGDSFDILHAFIEIVRAAGCELLVDSTGEVIPPDVGLVETAVRGHPAFQFMSDPHGAVIKAADETKRLRKQK
jgi:hypothetical protein